MRDATPGFDPYFQSYAEAIARFFHSPCLMVNADFTAMLDSREAVIANMEALNAHHRSAGLARAEPTVTEIRQAAANLASVTVSWCIYRADDSLLWDFRNTY